MATRRTRRQFIKSGMAATAAVFTTGAGVLIAPRVGEAAEYPDLVVCKGSPPEATTRRAVEALGGMKRFVKPGNKVVIKPNMSFASDPESASNTNPAVVAEVARLCKEAGAATIAVLDNVLGSPRSCLQLSQIPQYCASVPDTVVSNVRSPRLFKTVPVPQGKEFKRMSVVKAALDADVLIAVPVGKSHSSSGVSLSMKGMMGLIEDRGSFHTKYNLHEAIVDMVTVLTPQLVVVDGTRILSTGGPGGPGEVIPLDLIVASTDMVAADAQMVALGTWYGKKFRPDQVRHIRRAAERGLGRIDLDNMNVKKIGV